MSSDIPTPEERQQGFLIIQAIDEATSHLADGLTSLVRPGWSISDHPATFTALASGVERLAKVCIGLAGIDSTGQWTKTRNAGHDLGALLRRLDGILDERVGRATGTGYIQGLRATVDADPALPHIFAALDAWAAAPGRYGTLDSLGGRPRSDERPIDLWEEAELAARTPDILAGLADPSGQALVALRRSLARSVLLWWLLVHRAWAHGMFGPLGKQMSSAVDPRRPTALAPFSKEALEGF